jgi:formylglycine-generating enzyme required for sulfatase activity
LQFDPNFEFLLNELEDNECPANRLWMITAMKYCRWLSEQEGIAEDQMCYPPTGEITESHLQLSDEMISRTSYRLPTEAEWQIACSAGTLTDWSYGSSAEQIVHFGWSAANSMGRLHPCGTLIPNPLGIFDMHGNIGEWCHADPAASSEYSLRGGNYNFAPPLLATRELYYTRSNPYSFTGVRPARTINFTNH